MLYMYIRVVQVMVKKGEKATNASLRFTERFHQIILLQNLAQDKSTFFFFSFEFARHVSELSFIKCFLVQQLKELFFAGC